MMLIETIFISICTILAGFSIRLYITNNKQTII